MKHFRSSAAALAAILLCGAAAAQDSIPPSPVTVAAAAGIKSVTLTWTNSGDDGMAGQATYLEIYMSTARAISDDDYDHSTLVATPDPLAPNVAQQVLVSNLTPGQQHWFAVWAVDEVGNYSTVAANNNGTATPLPDAVPPDAVQLNVTTATNVTVALAWTAPGEDGASGTAAGYDIRYRTSAPILTNADFNDAATVRVVGEPTPKPASSAETFTISGLASETTYHFALKTVDISGNASALSNSASATTQAAPGSYPDSWANDLPPIPATVNIGASMVEAGNALYALPANNSKAFYRFSAGAWTALPDAPGGVNLGGVMAWDGSDTIYASGGYRTTTLWKFSISQNAWASPSAVAAAPFGMGPATELSCGKDGVLYLISGEYPGRLARYHIAINLWETLPDSNDVNSQMDAMASMPGSDTVYIFHANRFRAFSKSLKRWDVDADGEPVTLPAPPEAIFPARLCAHPSGKWVYLVATDRYSVNHLSRFDVATNTWSPLTAPVDALGSGMSCAFSADGVYFHVLAGDGSTFLRYQTPDEAPDAPASMAQYLADGVTLLAAGATTIESKVIVKARVFDGDGEPVRVEVRVAPAGQAFTGPAIGPSAAVASGGTVTVEIDGLLPNGQYHWQMRSLDPRNLPSAWTNYGTGTFDFSTRTNALPSASQVAQRRAGGATLASGESTADATITFRARVDDADQDAVRLEIELIRAGGLYSGTPTSVGPLLPSGSTAEIPVRVTEGSYEWRYRTVDAFGKTTGWNDYPGGGADFVMLSGGSTSSTNCGQTAGAGAFAAWLLPLAALAAGFRRR